MNLKQIEKYRKLLEANDIALSDVGEWLDNIRPQKLYKYMRFDSYWRQNVFDGQFFLAPAENINDPFDCLAYIDHQKYAEHMMREASDMFPMVDRQIIISSVQETMEIDLDKILNEKIRKSFRLSSLSESLSSPLMWAHYTNNHTGFCIEYDMNRLAPGYKHGILPVIYSDERYDATEDFISLSGNQLMNLCLFKSSCWKYEKEWRMVIPENIVTDGEYYADFKNAISAIYLGIKSSEKHHDKILEICAKYQEIGIPVYQMGIEHKSYQLKYKQIK